MHLHRPVPRLLVAAAACAAALSLAACSSSSSSAPPAASTSPSAPAPSPSAAPASSPAAAAGGLTTSTQKTIAANWTEFFNPKAPTAKRVALLQDASALSAALSGMATNPQAQTSSAKVDAVAVQSSTRAQVTYDILVSGTPMVNGQTGEAVLEGGTWKVSVASFCGLLALEAGGSTGKLPAACKSAS